MCVRIKCVREASDERWVVVALLMVVVAAVVRPLVLLVGWSGDGSEAGRVCVSV